MSSTHPHRLRPRGAAATVIAGLAISAIGLAACSPSSSTPTPDEPQQLPRNTGAPSGQQPVPSPSADDLELLGSELTTTPAPRPVSQPNLLMITVDDATVDDLADMPAVQSQLVDQGLNLTNGIAPTPICVPARASLLTGQYTHNHGALTINGDGGGVSSFDDAGTLPVWLRDAGYDTMFVGKYLNGYGQDVPVEYVPPGWTDWQATIDPTTYNYLQPTFSDNGQRHEWAGYSTDVISQVSQNLLAAPERADQPWYLWVNYVAPHFGGPRESDDPGLKTPAVAEKYRDSFADRELPTTPDMFEQDVSDKVLTGATQRRWGPEGRASLRELNQQRLESLQSVDDAVAATLDTLRRTGQLDNTYVVFTSDNGYAVGQHNVNGKLWPYEEILTVPMVISGPGLPRGTSSSTPVTNADWAPTFAALAGAMPTRAVDGIDVWPWLTRSSERVIPIEGYPLKGGPNRKRRYLGVTVGEWLYVRNPGGGGEELYHHGEDPHELHNLAGDPRFTEMRDQLRELTAETADCAGATCPRAFYAVEG